MLYENDEQNCTICSITLILNIYPGGFARHHHLLPAAVAGLSSRRLHSYFPTHRSGLLYFLAHPCEMRELKLPQKVWPTTLLPVQLPSHYTETLQGKHDKALLFPKNQTLHSCWFWVLLSNEQVFNICYNDNKKNSDKMSIHGLDTIWVLFSIKRKKKKNPKPQQSPQFLSNASFE